MHPIPTPIMATNTAIINKIYNSPASTAYVPLSIFWITKKYNDFINDDVNHRLNHNDVNHNDVNHCVIESVIESVI